MTPQNRKMLVMPRNLEVYHRFTLEEHNKILEEMDKEYPTALKFNVKGEFEVPEGLTSVKMESLGIEFLSGSGPIDFRILVTRSGSDLESINADFGRMEQILDAMSFVRLGRRVRASPALPSAEMSVSDPINDVLIQRTSEVLDAMAHVDEPLRSTIERSLAWFRDSFQAVSTFNHFATLWNSLENLVLPLGEDDKPTRDQRLKDAKEFISSKGSGLTLEDLETLNSEIVQQSIRRRMVRGFESLLAEDSQYPISLCFERDPPETQLWRIRNDILHANIVERDVNQRGRVLGASSDLFVVTWNSISKVLDLRRQLAWEM